MKRSYWIGAGKDAGGEETAEGRIPGMMPAAADSRARIGPSGWNGAVRAT